jgi:type 1 glutamine amidotransferase
MDSKPVPRRIGLLLLALCSALPLTAQTLPPGYDGPDLSIPTLVFTGVGGFRHAGSIEAATALLKRMDTLSRSSRPGAFRITPEFSEDAGVMDSATLRKYRVVVLLECTEAGKILNDRQQRALLRFVDRGGGLVAIHGSLDTKGSWPEYQSLMGGAFTATLPVSSRRLSAGSASKAKPIRAGLPDRQDLRDEWHTLTMDGYGDLRSPAFTIVDSIPSSGFPDQAWLHTDIPVSWIRASDYGRIFATAMGHSDSVVNQCYFGRLLRNGILWAAREETYSQSDALAMPEWDCAATTGLAPGPDPERGSGPQRAPASGFSVSRIGGAPTVTLRFPGAESITLWTLDGRIRARLLRPGPGAHAFRGVGPGTMVQAEVRWIGGRTERALISPAPAAP